MKVMMGIFDYVFRGARFALLGLCVAMGSAYAADATGCDDPDNDMINGDFALCSVHAYNIWETENNPDNKDLMREVVAMKTTLITQQMYKQYEQIDSMVRRLKTQLEKATLKNDFKYAGANSDDDSSSSGGRNDEFAKMDNCAYESDIGDALGCYERHLEALRRASDDGKEVTTQMKKQLAKDYEELRKLQIGEGYYCMKGEMSKEKMENDTDNCFNMKKDGSKTVMMTRKQFEKCIGNMSACLRNAKNAYKNEERKYSSGNWNRN